MTKLPVKPEGGAGRQGSLDHVISQLRSKTNKPERRLVTVVCSSHGQGFDVVFERTDPRKRYKIARIEKNVPGAVGGLPARHLASSAATTASFDIKEFDNSGFACPWCRNTDGQVFHHECETYYCGGSRHVAADGTDLFTCPSCKKTLVCNVIPTSIQGRTAPRPADSGGMKALGQQARKLLPRWPAK